MSGRRQAAASATAKPAVARLRCAIYTRKSSEEGLDQSFNSLDAQREACEAYIMSQVGEGWTALPTHYDDGGFSGGSMERPGLKRLLADIELRKIDVVVVYKVDRLTRSLADFAKIVETFDGHGVSFVSVTQAFNTTSSMGRLTLNVLLSFAQFEREVTGERIRDKIAASKKKGMWMGGTAPLGYRPHERTLAIDEAEAVTVRHIYQRYLALGSVHALRAELDAQGYRTRPCKRTGGEVGARFFRGALYHMLTNRTYLGEIVHKGEFYPGQHPPIVERELFYQVALMLASHRSSRGERTVEAGAAPLTGLIFDADRQPLCPVSARNRHGRVYRYYVSSHLQRGEAGGANDNARRLPAPAIEALVLDKLRTAMPAITDWASARARLREVVLDDDTLTIVATTQGRVSFRTLDPDDRASVGDDGLLRVATPMRLRRWAGRTEIVRGGGGRAEARVDRSLTRGLARAHALLRKSKVSPDRSIEEIGAGEGVAASYARRLIRLAFLAPDIQRAIMDGRQPGDINLEKLMRADMPLSWTRQRGMLGFATA